MFGQWTKKKNKRKSLKKQNQGGKVLRNPFHCFSYHFYEGKKRLQVYFLLHTILPDLKDLEMMLYVENLPAAADRS